MERATGKTTKSNVTMMEVTAVGRVALKTVSRRLWIQISCLANLSVEHSKVTNAYRKTKAAMCAPSMAYVSAKSFAFKMLQVKLRRSQLASERLKQRKSAGCLILVEQRHGQWETRTPLISTVAVTLCMMSFTTRLSKVDTFLDVAILEINVQNCLAAKMPSAMISIV